MILCTFSRGSTYFAVGLQFCRSVIGVTVRFNRHNLMRPDRSLKLKNSAANVPAFRRTDFYFPIYRNYVQVVDDPHLCRLSKRVGARV